MAHSLPNFFNFYQYRVLFGEHLLARAANPAAITLPGLVQPANLNPIAQLATDGCLHILHVKFRHSALTNRA